MGRPKPFMGRFYPGFKGDDGSKGVRMFQAQHQRPYKTGATRKTPLMRVKDGNNYVLVGSQGGAPKHPVWVHNLHANPNVEIRDATEVYQMRVREVTDAAERDRVWALGVEAYPPYEDYQNKTSRKIPVFIAEQG